MIKLDDAYYWFKFTDGTEKLGEVDEGKINLFDQTDPKSHGELVGFVLLEAPNAFSSYDETEGPSNG